MNTEKIFKSLLVIQFLLCILGGLWWSAFAEIPVGDYISNTAGMILSGLMVVYLVNLYFLFRFKPFARKIYVPLIVVMLALVFGLPEDYFYQNAGIYVLDCIGAVLVGMTIAIVYWTEISKKFEG